MHVSIRCPTGRRLTVAKNFDQLCQAFGGRLRHFSTESLGPAAAKSVKFLRFPKKVLSSCRGFPRVSEGILRCSLFQRVAPMRSGADGSKADAAFHPADEGRAFVCESL